MNKGINKSQDGIYDVIENEKSVNIVVTLRNSENTLPVGNLEVWQKYYDDLKTEKEKNKMFFQIMDAKSGMTRLIDMTWMVKEGAKYDYGEY